ncbi:hypothetical protein [Microbacterium sp. SORGH_AS_0888]|uniref:hypothetical protein n=1 Tax=Microbacterium sp. SORGH_AS_0888 TaxID=3041791 RepID=UPI00277E0736|nr:hypothetical protein [Microbacterium sp. SORGH_AS_0888]MDQ1130404.1 hypothetical protein [Microbacterium sp. SORGH_AS_0888]
MITKMTAAMMLSCHQTAAMSSMAVLMAQARNNTARASKNNRFASPGELSVMVHLLPKLPGLTFHLLADLLGVHSDSIGDPGCPHLNATQFQVQPLLQLLAP